MTSEGKDIEHIWKKVPPLQGALRSSLVQWFSNCGSRISVTWELVRDATPRVLPSAYRIQTSAGGALQVFAMLAQVEEHCSC